jgi:glucosamine--fructose-6-phosphate aminotransferase (isomerizing)
MFADEIGMIIKELNAMPDKIQAVIDHEEQTKKLGADMKDARSVLFLGRHVGFPVAL